MPAAAWRILLEIEQLNHSWVIPDQPFDHTYGRLPGEVEIRPWSVPRSTGQFLNTLVRLLQPRRVVEIGTSLAYSAIWMACGAPEGAIVDTVEILPAKADLARSHIAQAGLANIHLHQCEALDFTSDGQDEVDLVFFDADPENYIAYFESLSPRLSSGAVLVMDNALNHRPETEEFANYVAQISSWQSWIHPLDNGLLIARPRR